jgi:hypothetical protein
VLIGIACDVNGRFGGDGDGFWQLGFVATRSFFFFESAIEKYFGAGLLRQSARKRFKICSRQSARVAQKQDP